MWLHLIWPILNPLLAQEEWSVLSIHGNKTSLYTLITKGFWYQLRGASIENQSDWEGSRTSSWAISSISLRSHSRWRRFQRVRASYSHLILSDAEAPIRVIPTTAADLNAALEMGIDWSLREGYAWAEDKAWTHCFTQLIRIRNIKQFHF